jgi:hypothetical protein
LVRFKFTDKLFGLKIALSFKNFNKLIKIKTYKIKISQNLENI